jgi:hypothetical protein
VFSAISWQTPLCVQILNFYRELTVVIVVLIHHIFVNIHLVVVRISISVSVASKIHSDEIISVVFVA